jgi:RNA polymerase sigma-70 factor (ECF subfamily)
MHIVTESLLDAIKQGDKQAFEKLFKEHYAPLCRYAYTFLKDAQEAEEAVQGVFLAIWERREELSINTSVKSYLYQMVHNRSLNQLKHEKVKEAYKQYNHTQINQNPANASHLTIQNELASRIEQAIDELPEQCRKVFRMSRVDELKYSEIAEVLGISIKTVENHMSKALKHLREKLSDYLVALCLFLLFS